MADSPEQQRHPTPARENAPSNTSRPPSYSYSAQTHNERNRVPSDNQHESQDYQRFLGGGTRAYGDYGSIRSMDSRFSMNEHFAASRRDFEFDLESDTESILEPAPIIDESLNDDDDDDRHTSRQDTGSQEDDATSDISDAEILRLMDADDNELDYYTVLSLPRDPPPTTAQIRSAYHRLSLAFHPDKQPPALRAAAERHFSRIQKAYETLVEPRKRVIYDLEGEEGLREEYKPGGAMGKGGEKDMLEVGVKTLSPVEFKAWFMSILRKREQKAVEALVGSSGSIELTLDVRDYFRGKLFRKIKDKETDEVVAVIPAPKLEILGLEIEHDFVVPLSGVDQFYQRSLKSIKDLIGQESDIPVEELQESSWEAAAYENCPTLTISTGVQGRVVNQQEAHFIENEPVPLIIDNPMLLSQDFTIGAGISHQFQSVETSNSKTASWLSGSQISCSTTFLPRQTYKLGISRAFTLLENTRPFIVNVEANQEHDTNPPQLSATITRPMTKNSSIFCRLHSGSYMWPSWAVQVLDFIFNLPNVTMLGSTPSSVQLGWVYSAAGIFNQDDSDSNPISGSTSTANEAWKVSLNAWSTTMNVTASYARDLFARSQNPPVRSRIMNSGEALPNQKPRHRSIATGVRLEVDTGLNVDMSPWWTVTGLKRVGDFTSVGFAVGVKFSLLSFQLTWQRLGQSVRIPVMVLPPELFNKRAVFFSLAFPWGLYSAYEFLLLRPAERKARRKLVRQKRKELRASVARKREEALQAVALMSSQVAYKQAIESENNGLVVLEARYGSPSASTHRTGMGEFVPGEVVDVTIPLASLIEGSQLVLIKKVDRNGIPGFYDPVPLGRKGLGVKYLFGGKEHEVFVSDKEGLVLPQREHEVHVE